MAYAAYMFDTLDVAEKLEEAGFGREQAKAISKAVHCAHESLDVATKRDVGDVRKDMEMRFEKTEAQISDVHKELSFEIADVHKELSFEIADVRKDMEMRFEKTESQISDVRKDMQLMQKHLIITLGSIIVGTVTFASALIGFMLKFSL